MYQLTTLPGGLQVATAAMPHMHSVSMGIFLGVGSRHEPEELSGISHFLEHMLFKGTDRRDVRQIAMEIEGNGGSLNAYTGEEYTCFESRGPAELLPVMADVLSDMVLRPGFPEDELARERDVVLEEITMYRETPSDHVQELSSQALWGTHTLGRSILGTPDTLSSLDRKTLAQFHSTHYKTPAHTIAVAGACSHEEVLDLITRLYEGESWHNPKPSPLPYNPVLFPSPGNREEKRDLEQSHLILGYTTIGYHDPRRHALRLLSVLLGESMSSRLFQEIREKRGLAYSIYSDTSFFSECGAFTIYAGVDATKKEEALDTISKELSTLLQSGCTLEELNQAKRYSLGQLTLMRDSTLGQLNWIGDSSLNHGRIIPPEETQAAIQKVNQDDIMEVATLLLEGRTPVLASVGG